MMQGSCLCGNVMFKVLSAPLGMSVCHCGQCRKQSGHMWASAFVPISDLAITGQVTWFASSPAADRGFCPVCGSFLFWRGAGEATISFALGAIDGATGLRLTKHIFTADKGDYYDIADGIPQSS